MKKNRGSLTFPTNALARLQELRAETEGLLKEPSEEVSNEVSNEISPLEEGREGMLGVRAKLAGQGVKEPTSRLNVELRDSLHTRLKSYCARQKLPIRVVVDALIEEFLAQEEQQLGA